MGRGECIGGERTLDISEQKIPFFIFLYMYTKTQASQSISIKTKNSENLFRK